MHKYAIVFTLIAFTFGGSSARAQQPYPLNGTTPMFVPGLPGVPMIPRTARRYPMIVPHAGVITGADRFVGGVQANVVLVGGGASNLDIYIYDAQTRRLITRGIGLSDRETLFFRPTRSGWYVIQVRNRGNVPNRAILFIW